MRPRYCLPILVFCWLCSGCELLQLAASNIAYEAWLEKERAITAVRCRTLAEQAWRESPGPDHGHSYSVDYACGFKDGYADCIQTYGCLLPPALPPRQYWSARFQTPQGHHAIEEWFLGYEHGAQAARASSHREFIPVPILGLAPALTPPLPGEPWPEAASVSGGLLMPRPVSAFPMAAPAAVPPPPQKESQEK